MSKNWGFGAVPNGCYPPAVLRMSTYVSKHRRRLMSLAPTLNHLSGFWRKSRLAASSFKSVESS